MNRYMKNIDNIVYDNIKYTVYLVIGNISDFFIYNSLLTIRE